MRYLRLLCVLIAGLFLMGATSKEVSVDMDKVAKVERQIQKISQAEPVEKTSDLRTEEVRENEINAYIAHLISQEKQKVLKSLQVTLGAANQVTGRAIFDLAGLSLGAFLPPSMRFDFEGDLETKGRKGRFNVKKLLLDNEPIKPEFLDVLFFAIASAYDTEPSSIKDWYELPYGIDSIKSSKGSAVFYY